MDPAKREDYTEMLLAEGGKARCTVVIAEDAGEKVARGSGRFPEPPEKNERRRLSSGNGERSG